MKIIRALIFAPFSLLASCGSLTVPAAVKMESGEVFIGTTTASMSGGRFEVQNASRTIICKGTYDALDTSIVISAPVQCSDGRYGTLTVTRTPDLMAGTGTVTLADGTVGNVAFGKLAALAISAPASPFVAATASSNTTASSSDATSPRTPACESPNYYGAISCVTGLPKTTYVRGHYRKNGTYVRPYYRSKR